MPNRLHAENIALIYMDNTKLITQHENNCCVIQQVL